MKPWTPQQEYRLCDADDIPAPSYTAERRNARDHFQSKMEGNTCTMASLVTNERETAAIKAVARDLVPKLLFVVVRAVSH